MDHFRQNDFFAPNGQSRGWQRCFGAKYQFLSHNGCNASGEPISSLKIIKDKTQVLKMEHKAENDAEICGDLGLTYVKKLKILGVTLLCFGRVELVKSLALSRLTHIVQVIPHPADHLLDKLQTMVSNFIRTGSQNKKKVVKAEIAMQTGKGRTKRR